MTCEQTPDQYTLAALAVRLYFIAIAERDESVAGLARATLSNILPALDALKVSHLVHADRYVAIDDIRNMALDPGEWDGKVANQCLDRPLAMKEWAQQSEV
jgi:hypothetical protein